MENAYFISVDIGTSSAKIVLMDLSGNCIASVSREYPTEYEENNGAVQDAALWWETVQGGLARLAKSVPEEMKKVQAISVDGQSSTVLPVDGEGNILSRAMIWMDKRAVQEEEQLRKYPGQQLFTEINGNYISAANIAPKILWIKNNQPEIYDRTWKFFTSEGFIVYRLTGKDSCDVTEGGLSQLMDMRRLEWSGELIRACGIDEDKLPKLYRSYEVVGEILPEVASSVGLRAGIRVVAGSMDVCACALGTGVDRESAAFITGGTVTALGVGTGAPIMDGKLHVYPHIVPGVWFSVAGVDFGGGNYRWFRDNFMEEYTAEDAYREMNRLAAQSPPGANRLLFLPSSVGQRCPQWDIHMRGAFIGVAPSHEKKDFLRAIMEGNAFGIREIMDIQEAEGASIDRIMIAGGISKSDLWMQIFSAVLKRKIMRVHSQQDTAYGNLINAAYGTGYIDTFDPPLPGRQMEEMGVMADNGGAYEKLYEIFSTIYPSLKKTFDMLAAAGEEIQG